MRKRGLEVLFIIILIALLALLARPGYQQHSEDHDFLELLVTSATIQTPELPEFKASVAGVSLGMTRAKAEGHIDRYLGSKWVFRFNPESTPYLTYESDRGVIIVRYKEDKVCWVSGPTLEFNGHVLLEPGVDPDSITDVLGAPDSIGLEGVSRCEGAYGGYWYAGIQATIAFRWDGANQVTLGPR